MEKIIKRFTEPPRRVFTVGVIIGLMFGVAFGMIFETKFNIFAMDNANRVHNDKMNDLEYLSKVALIKKEMCDKMIFDNGETVSKKLDSLALDVLQREYR